MVIFSILSDPLRFKREMETENQENITASLRRWPIIILYGTSLMLINFNVSLQK